MFQENPTVDKVRNELIKKGFADAAQKIRWLDQAAPTAAAAAALIPCEVGAIANSLVFVADSEPLLIMTSGSHRVDTEYVAQLIGVSALKRATPEFVREKTGQPIGGVAPTGHPAPIKTYIDVALKQYREIWVAGGHPHTVFPLSFDHLVSLTQGTVITVVPGYYRSA
jgi:prolyl-tRNA editing enzyme YbaK/EbsC (Cys-tRNA(Pro) deacylase)